MSSTFELRPGDIAAIAIHQPDRDEANRLLVHSGWGESIELPEPEESAPQESG